MNTQTPTHSLSLADRRVMKVTAVNEVLSFDETNVTMSLGDLLLSVGGSDLSVSSLSLENGEVTICGCVETVVYLDDAKPRKKGIGRFFGA